MPNWTVESVNAPGQVWDPKKARVQAVIAGYHTPAATRTVSLVVNGKTIATRTVEVPANGRASVEFRVARRALRLQPLRGAHRFGRCLARRRCEPVRRRALRSRGESCSCTSRPTRARRSISAPRWPRLPKRRSRWTAIAVEQTANADPSQYAFVVLSDVLSLPAPFEQQLAEIRARAAAACWSPLGPPRRVARAFPSSARSILESRYYSRDGAALPDRGRSRSLLSVRWRRPTAGPA